VADIVHINLDEGLKQRLRERAAEHGRSMSAELHAIVTDALMRPESVDPVVEFKRLAAACRAMSTGRVHTPSEVLLRESRDLDAK
jgi:plasmid stability protein